RPSVVRIAVLRTPAEGEPAEFERRYILQEEVARLGREQREARRVDLTDVERRIRKIGIDGERVGERRRHLVERIAAGSHARIRAGINLPIALQARCAIELDVEADALTHILNPHEVAGLADVSELERRIDSRPVDTLVLVENASSDVESPGGRVRLVG